MRHIYRHKRDKHGSLVFQESADEDDAGEEKDILDEYQEAFYHSHRQRGLVDSQIDAIWIEYMRKKGFIKES